MMTSPDQLSPDSYQPSLDGLRAIAIIWVLLHNGRVMFRDVLDVETVGMKISSLLLSTGWLGVQLFFVLSGYLITGILLKARTKSFWSSIKRFYIRRALRIFPIYYVFLALIFLSALYFANASELIYNTYDNKLWFVFYLTNWFQPFEKVGLAHLWSLAVEEQFYLIWPLVIFTLPHKQLIPVCFLIVGIAITFRFFVGSSGVELENSPAYLMTPARFDALAIGALLSISLHDKHAWPKLNQIIAVLCLSSLCYFLMTLAITHDFASVATNWAMLNQSFAAIFFATLIYYSLNFGQTGDSSRALIRYLSLPWLRTIGKYSYAMYIFHWPLARLIGDRLTNYLTDFLPPTKGLSDIAIIIANESVLFTCSYILAFFSWRLVEQPFLKLKRHWPM